MRRLEQRQKTDRQWKQDGVCLQYYSRKAMKRRYPQGGYLLLGGIGEGLKEQNGQASVGGEEIPYYALRYAKWKYGIDGYAACDGREEYLAVVKNYLPRHILLLFLILALIGGLMGGMYMLGRSSALDENAVDFSPVNGETIEPDPDHIAFPAYRDLKIEAGTDVLHTALWNPKKNTCYFQFTIKERKNDTVLYKSKLVEPGKAIKEVKLPKAVEAGTQEVTILVDTYDLNDQEVRLNSAKLEVKLIGVVRRE